MHYLAKYILRRLGWKCITQGQFKKKFVLVAAPHTSNWDFPLMLFFGLALNLNYNWLGKHTLFFWPLGGLMKRLGGIPVNRTKKNSYVSNLAERISEKERCILIIPPEGTRSRTEYWKSGFIHIAKEACVPIVFANLDYKNKSLDFSVGCCYSRSASEIIQAARGFYKNSFPLHPKKFGPVRLKP